MARKRVLDQESIPSDAEMKRLEKVVKSLTADLAESGWPDFQIEVQTGESRISVRLSGRAAEAPRELPLVEAAGGDLKQGDKVPNKPEVDTVGAFVKRIHRTDPEFATLVSNKNPKIVFKEHEGRGYWRGGVWTTW